MGELSIFQRIKQMIGGVCFNIFIWSTGEPKERYWFRVWEQEDAIINPKPKTLKEAIKIARGGDAPPMY